MGHTHTKFEKQKTKYKKYKSKVQMLLADVTNFEMEPKRRYGVRHLSLLMPHEVFVSRCLVTPNTKRICTNSTKQCAITVQFV